MPHPDAPRAPPPAPEPPAASLLWPAVFALLAWAAFAAAMVILPQIHSEAAPPWNVLVARMGALAVYSKEFFLGPLVLVLAIGWLSRFVQRPRPLDHALIDGLRFGVMFFGGSAVIWLAIATWSSLQGDDPWESLPGITPPYLEAFLARNPGVEVTTYGGTHQLRLHDGKGHSLFVDGGDIADAVVRFEPCSPRDTDPAALGGIPPYPGARCDTLLRVRRGEIERVIHAFVVVRDDNHERIQRHFERWADTIGARRGFSGGPNHYFFTAYKDDTRWDLRLFVSRHGATEIYIPRGGVTRAWAGAHDRAENR